MSSDWDMLFQVSGSQPNEGYYQAVANMVWSPGERFGQAVLVISVQVIAKIRE